ncbi:MAG: ABC transporter permease subunit [Armatimonadetes bacterium]|nr:ABC transporter permease subunit [Armatimonadota bacterium]
MKVRALIADTFREIYAKKVILGIVVIEVLTLVVTGLVVGMLSDSYDNARTTTSSSFITTVEYDSTEAHDTTADRLLSIAEDSAAITATPADTTTPSKILEITPADSVQLRSASNQESLVTEMVRGQLAAYSTLVGVAVFLLAIFATAGIVPSMMEKGTIDVLISKPVDRAMLLFGRTLGGIIAVGANLLLFVLGIFAIYGFFSGIWLTSFVVWTFLISFFGFLVFYSFVVCMNILSESWVLPMSLSYIHIFLFSSFLSNREDTLYLFITSPILQTIIDGLYWILPQPFDLVEANRSLIFSGMITSYAPFIQGAIFILVMSAVAVWRFRRKDF